MKLSEWRKVLENAQEVSQRLGNPDPEITFWHRSQEPNKGFDVVIHPDLSECLIIKRESIGNYAFQIQEIDL